MVEPSCEGNNTMDTNLEILSPSLQDSMKSIIKKAKYIKYDVIIKYFDSRGDNFLGKLYEVDIIGETLKCKKDTNIFIKESPIMDNFKLVPIESSYSREKFIYTDLSKNFTSLQDQANVPQADRYKIAKAYDETNVNALILENLSKRDFRTYTKREPMPIKFAELAVQELAKFHALTFVIEYKMPEYYNQKIKVLENLFCLDEDWNGMIRNICTYVANLYNDETKQKIENFLPIFLEKFPKYSNDRTTIKCTLTHGDYKKNNLLVRLKDGEPVEVIPVDYQFSDYGCPIRDLLFFIFSGTDREFRRKYMDHLKELYFEKLSRFLKYFNMDVENVYPRQEFEKVYTEWLDYGLMMTLFASVVMFAPDAGLDLENLTLAKLPYHPDKNFDEILRGLVEDFVEWGYL